jgi:glutamate/tyrosine decarboxylase-like PLP-dependent enzyme
MNSLNEEKFLNDVFLTLKKYLDENTINTPVIKSSTPLEMNKLVPELSQSGVSSREFLNELQFILDRSVRTTHPLFLNQLFGGADTFALLGDLVGSLLNPTMATFEVAPVLTVIEKRLVKELLKLTGLETVKELPIYIVIKFSKVNLDLFI